MGVSSELLAASALIAVPTVFVAAWLYSRWSSKGALLGAIALCGAGLLGADPPRARRRRPDASPVLVIALLIVGINGIIAMLLPYAAESYPLQVRGRATGWVAACTKAGGLAAQLLGLLGLVPGLAWAAVLAWCRCCCRSSSSFAIAARRADATCAISKGSPADDDGSRRDCRWRVPLRALEAAVRISARDPTCHRIDDDRAACALSTRCSRRRRHAVAAIDHPPSSRPRAGRRRRGDVRHPDRRQRGRDQRFGGRARAAGRLAWHDLRPRHCRPAGAAEDPGRRRDQDRDRAVPAAGRCRPRAATCRSTATSARSPSTSARACRRRRPTFNQGMRLAFAFNHAEAQRAFQAAQRLDPDCAMCFWGEALVLGPNINVPMIPEANAPALAALAKAVAAEGEGRRARSRADRRAGEALLRRSEGRPGRARRCLRRRDEGRRRTLSGRRHRADAVRRSGDGHAAVGLLGSRRRAGPRAAAPRSSRALETVLKRNPSHPGAIHLYIHAVEASTQSREARCRMRSGSPR